MAKLDLNQVRFVIGVSTATRIDPRVVIAWMQQEGANAPGGTSGFNYLNLRPLSGDPYKTVSSGGFEQFASVNDAVKATVRRLNQPFAKPIVATARTRPTPQAQIRAISTTGWDAGHYGGGGGIELQRTFSTLFKGGLNDSYLDPGNARAVANTVSTGSASPHDPIGSTPSVIDSAASAANDAARHIPGVAQIEDIGSLFKWIGNNWDRIGIAAAGIIFVILGFALIAGKTKTAALMPPAAAPKTGGKAAGTFAAVE